MQKTLSARSMPVSPSNEERGANMATSTQGSEGLNGLENDTNTGGEKETIWSDTVDVGTAVIWGDQITTTIKRLKSITFFALGSAPIPAPQSTEAGAEATDGAQSFAPGTKSKRRGKGGNAGRGNRKKKGVTSALANQEISEGGGSSEVMGQEENSSSGGVEVMEEVNHNSVDFVANTFELDDVANFECVQSEDKVEMDETRRRRAGGGKPNSTYTDIITRALEENPAGLTVSGIYDYIVREYPYFHRNDDRWKNSVRHNLSISPYFHKGDKSTTGAGHVWTIAEDCKDIRAQRRRNGNEFQTRQKGPGRQRSGGLDMSTLKTETDFAVANILTDYIRASNGGEDVQYEQEAILIDVEEGVGQEEQQITFVPILDETSFAPQKLTTENENMNNETTVACQQIEIELASLNSSSDMAPTQIILDPSDENSMCFLEKSTATSLEHHPDNVVSINVENGMMLNLESYFQGAGADIFFLGDDDVVHVPTVSSELIPTSHAHKY